MNDDMKNKDDIAKDVENCTKVFTLSEFSRETGIRIELLRRFISRQTRQMRNEAWEKIYPSIKELLGESDPQLPRRVGPPYRRHQELVEMISDQKVLLDVFYCLSSSMQQELRRGTLVLCVLKELHEPMYGYSLIGTMAEKGIRLEANTLYPLMRRLEGETNS